MGIVDIAQGAEDVADHAGGKKAFEPAREGIALLRMCSYIELGEYTTEWKGKKKVSRKVLVEFELVHPDHKIIGQDGQFKGYYKVTVRLNKSGFDKSKYMKLFNKMNFDGSVPHTDGKIPALSKFLGKPFLGQVFNNTWKEKIYTNLDKDGDFFIGAPKAPETDPGTGMPTGLYRDITVPEMNAVPRMFLWESPGMSKSNYHEMWESIYIEGEKDDGTSKNWIQLQILSEENIGLPGSVAEDLFLEKGALEMRAEDPAVLADLGIE